MRAKAAFRLVADRRRLEVVDIADGETLLFWELRDREARRFARALREDLNLLEADDFLARWSAVQAPGDVRR